MDRLIRRVLDALNGSRELGRDIIAAMAPGRVNLIGEHTDYNDGFVLPMAIDRYTVVACTGRADGMLKATSIDFGETKEAALADLLPRGQTGWFGYVAGVAWALEQEGVRLHGADIAIAGDVPIGAGLASSAALELAVARALCGLAGMDWHPERMAALGRKAENLFVGVGCGIMDQFAAAASRVDHAMLLDCRSLELELVPIPPEVSVVVLDTGVRRRLATGEYDRRRASCAAAMQVLAGVSPSARALRDVDSRTLESVEHLLDPVTYRRAKHVVGETHRPVEMAAAMRSADLERAGLLMEESHASLRDLYEVSSVELDAMVASALAQRGCIGARMTGAGFGGCAVALVHEERTGQFVTGAAASYAELTGQPGNAFAVRPAAGAALVEL